MRADRSLCVHLGLEQVAHRSGRAVDVYAFAADPR